MTRRSFFSALAGLPLVGKIIKAKAAPVTQWVITGCFDGNGWCDGSPMFKVGDTFTIDSPQYVVNPERYDG